MDKQTRSSERPEWREQQLCYQVLRSVYEQTDGDCTRSVTAAQLALPSRLLVNDVLRSIEFLAERGFLFQMGERMLVCITPKGTRYIERAAGRRKSLRLSASA